MACSLVTSVVIGSEGPERDVRVGENVRTWKRSAPTKGCRLEVRGMLYTHSMTMGAFRDESDLRVGFSRGAPSVKATTRRALYGDPR
ncbi:hypothetical protein Mapa_015703 [Marchantia paleacea]|nr:hypothetical protein Mapa_015703 [Marchantia paleacea]